jgi:hypothetical protein
VCCRVGIMTARLRSCTTGDSRGRGAVVVSHAGKKIRLPGRVLYVLPVGDFQVTVPSGSCRSAQPPIPVQNVLSRWCYRLAKEHSRATESTISHATFRPERYCSNLATVTSHYPNGQAPAPTPTNHCQRSHGGSGHHTSHRHRPRPNHEQCHPTRDFHPQGSVALHREQRPAFYCCRTLSPPRRIRR